MPESGTMSPSGLTNEASDPLEGILAFASSTIFRILDLTIPAGAQVHGHLGENHQRA